MVTVEFAACLVHLLLWRSLANKSYETAKSISSILIWLCIVKKILIFSFLNYIYVASTLTSNIVFELIIAIPGQKWISLQNSKA